jgi:hypothetical protein
MNKEKQQIKIAEAVGWKKLKDFSDSGWPLLLTPPEKPNKKWYLEAIPDYLNDLNAMHEAEKIIERLCKEGDYWFHLRELCAFPDAESDWNKVYFFTAVHAAADQRAEAFLKTLNLWEE